MSILNNYPDGPIKGSSSIRVVNNQPIANQKLLPINYQWMSGEWSSLDANTELDTKKLPDIDYSNIRKMLEELKKEEKFLQDKSGLNKTLPTTTFTNVNSWSQ